MAVSPSIEQGRRVEPGRLVEPRAPSKPQGTVQQGFGSTLRLDRWLLEPMAIGIGFTAFIVWSLISSLLLTPYVGVPYEAEGYLSPFFSPLIVLPFLPAWFSPAILILWIPLAFRATCYYYRKAYYRAFFFDPPACAVGEPSILKRFGLETTFPFILQNLHRYFLYLAFIPLFFLFIDALVSLRHDDQWRIGVGGVLLFANAILLGVFTLSCHALRHLVGGKVDCFSCTAQRRRRHELWQGVTSLNRNHPLWAWVSLISVVAADVYVRLLALGIIDDVALTF